MTLRTFAKLHTLLRTLLRYNERKESFLEVNYGKSKIWLHTRQQQGSK